MGVVGIKVKRSKYSMINIVDKANCSGCGACQQRCARQAIKMVEDKDGFLYPKVDIELCNECGLCEKVCPILNVEKEIPSEQSAYLVQHKDDEILRQSTSGGAFTAIAEWVLRKGGVVFGASYDSECLSVRHVYVEDYKSLSRFRNSKYVQSVIGNCYSQVESFLKSGRWVLFSGTPCQIEGLVRFLKKKNDQLVLLDVVCHSCPSPLVYRKYIEYRMKSSYVFSNILFRDKVRGYKYSAMSLFDKSGKRVYSEGIDTDVYLRAFFSDISVRQSCYNCAFKKRYRVSDFTLWDCFDVYRFSSELDNDKGVTRVLAHTDKANRIIEELSSAHVVKISADDAVAGVNEMFHSVSVNPSREQFFKDLNELPVDQCFEKWFPVTLRHRFEKLIRVISCKIGVYDVAKLVFKKIVKNRKIKR